MVTHYNYELVFEDVMQLIDELAVMSIESSGIVEFDMSALNEETEPEEWQFFAITLINEVFDLI